MKILTNVYTKIVILVFIDFCSYAFALWLSLSLRLGGFVSWFDYWPLDLLVAACSVIISLLAGVYRLVLRFFDERGIVRISFVILVASLNIALLLFWIPSIAISTPRSVIVIFGLVSFLLIVGGRFLYRILVNFPEDPTGLWRIRRAVVGQKNVAIYGAGEAGVAIMTSLRKGFEYNPVAFVDDDVSLQGRRLSDLPVVSREGFARLARKTNIDKVLIAMPKSSRANRNEIIQWLQGFKLKVLSLSDI